MQSELSVLATQDFFEISLFLTPAEVLDVSTSLRALQEEGQFRLARVGAAKISEPEIRSDEIFWIDDIRAALSKPLQNYFAKLEILRQHLNEKYYLGLKTHETHFSIYRPGRFYRRHFDVTTAESLRRVSLICYLNPYWKKGDGGELLLYLGDQVVEVQPLGGKLVGFLSRDVEHEVLPTERERLSLTSWFLV